MSLNSNRTDTTEFIIIFIEKENETKAKHLTLGAIFIASQ